MYDACVIGAGGLVGCAIVREPAQRGLNVAGLEKHLQSCQETSGFNSRVIHSGFHEAAGTLKSQLAREGSALVAEYARQHEIQLLQTGMLIAVPRGGIRQGLWRESRALWNLWQQGRRQNVSFKLIFTPAGVRDIAPIRALAGIFIPSVCVVNVEQLVASLESQARAWGATFIFGSEVTNARIEGSDYIVEYPGGRLRTRMLVNSAGLYAHNMSAIAGGPKYNVELLRGDYYELAGGVSRWNIRTLIYPAMPPGSPSKGVHIGPRTDGRLFIGPSATPPSTPMPKELFLSAGQRFLPNLSANDLTWAYSGLRPKATGADFIIRQERTNPSLINLIGIDSPGLSASLGIARYVADLMRD